MIKIFIHITSLAEGGKHGQRGYAGPGASGGHRRRGALPGFGRGYSAYWSDRRRDALAYHPLRLRIRDLGSDLPPLPGLRRLPGAARQPTEPSAAACGLVLCRGVLPQWPVGGACPAAPARAAADDTCGHFRVPGCRLPAPPTFGAWRLEPRGSVAGRAVVGAAFWLDHCGQRR